MLLCLVFNLPDKQLVWLHFIFSAHILDYPIAVLVVFVIEFRNESVMRRTESEISDWLSGDRNFTIDTLFEIGQALGVSFLSTSLHYSIADDSERYPAYEFEPLMASEP